MFTESFIFLATVQSAAMELRDKVANAIKQVDEKLSLEEFRDMDEAEKNSILKQYRETLHQCYNFGFEVGIGATV